MRTPIPIQLVVVSLVVLGAATAQGNRPQSTDPFQAVSRQPVVELDLDTPPEGRRSVVLLVIDQDEKPLGGVDVMVLEASALRTAEAREILIRQQQSQRRGPAAALAGVAAALGERYRTDADGRARVAWDKSAQACLLYRREATTALLRESDDPLEIRIPVPERLTVEVTDHRGKPAAGVLVTAVPPSGDDWIYRYRNDGVRTDGDGVALLPVPAASEGRTQVIARIAVRQPPRVDIVEGGTTRIALPPCGTLRVYFEGLAEPLDASRRSILLKLHSKAGTLTLIEPAEVGADFVTFGWVGLGEPVALSARLGKRGVEGLSLDAPRIPGEMKVFQVPVTDLAETVRIRLLTRAGEPLGRKPVGLFVVQPAREYAVGVTTQIDGTLTADIATDLDLENANVVVLARDDDPATQGFARASIAEVLAAAPEPFPMQLEAEPVLLSGRLLGPGGEPLVGVVVYTGVDLEPANPSGGHSGSSRNLGEAYRRNIATTDDDGGFTLREPYHGRATVSLSADLPEGLALADSSFAPGATGVIVNTTAVAAIRGNFADFPEDVERPLRVTLVHGEDGHRRTARSVGHDGTFRFDRLAPGSYTVELSTYYMPEAVVTFGDLIVGPDNIEHPELKDLDWREHFGLLRIMPQDESGAPVNDARITTVARDARIRFESTVRASKRGGDDTYRMWVAKGTPPDLIVTHPSYRSLNLEAVAADKTVTLAPRPGLRVRLGDSVELPAGLSLVPEVLAADEGEPADDSPAARNMQQQLLLASRDRPDAPEPIALTPILVRPDIPAGKAVLRLVGRLDAELANELRRRRGRFQAEFRRDVTVRLLDDAEGVPEVVFEPTAQEQEQLRTIAAEIEILRRN